MSELVFYANPYAYDARGFYFSTAQEYERKYKKHLPVEEYGIEFIDGSSADADLFRVMSVNQATLEAYLDIVEDLKDYEKPALFYYLDSYDPGADWDDALKAVEDEVRVREGGAKEYAESYIDDIGGVGELGDDIAARYFDYDSFGRAVKMDLDSDDPRNDDDDDDVGYEYVESIGGVSGLGDVLGATAENYFDVDRFARDLEMSGDISVFTFAGDTYTTDYRG